MVPCKPVFTTVTASAAACAGKINLSPIMLARGRRGIKVVLNLCCVHPKGYVFLSIHAIPGEIVNDFGFGESRRIPQITEIILRNFAQYPAHDFT